MTNKNNKMLKLRKAIDKADAQLLKALSNRFKVVKQIGIIKIQEKIPLVQKARWDELVQDRVTKAKALGLNAAFTKAILEIIHIEALSIQKQQKSQKKRSV